MEHFLDCIEEELHKQRQLLSRSQKILRHVPDGYLKIRRRKSGTAFYASGGSIGRNKEILITSDYNAVRRLFQKKVYSEMAVRAKENIAALERLQCSYRSNSYASISTEWPPAYLEAARFLGAEKSLNSETGKPIQHCFDPDSHFHETVCGLFVRSKSEVIIVNTLYNYGVPFDYERQFMYPDERGIYFRPDFSFDLPDGRQFIWEHLGLIKNLSYSEHTGRKLMTYQKHGFLIGRNLILTQDDENGNCSSAFIDEVVREKLLPYFR